MIKKYLCPKCGNIYSGSDYHPLPMDFDLHYCSHIPNGDERTYYCHKCLYEFLNKAYKPFKLEEVK